MEARKFFHNIDLRHSPLVSTSGKFLIINFKSGSQKTDFSNRILIFSNDSGTDVAVEIPLQVHWIGFCRTDVGEWVG